MKTKNKQIFYKLNALFLIMPFFMNAAGSVGGGNLSQSINTWAGNLMLVVNSVIGLAALGGGLYTYFKVQSDEGGSGKKAIGNYVLALIFGALISAIIKFFIPDAAI